MALKRIWVARTSLGVIVVPVYLCCALPGVFFGQQAFDRFIRRKVRVAIIEIAIGEGEVHRLINRMHISRAVKAHRFEVKVFKNVQRLKHCRALRPVRQLVNFDSLVRCRNGFFNVDLPFGEIFGRDQAALFFDAACDLPRDVALIESIICGENRVLTTLAGGQRLTFCFDELTQGCRELRLAKDLAGLRRFALLSRMRQHYFARIFPLL